MHPMLHAVYTRPLVCYLIAALVVLTSFAGPAEAMLVPAESGPVPAAAADRAADMAKIQTALESRALQQRLLDHGLTPEEVTVRLQGLPDEQVHELAANMDAVQAGGDGVGILFSLVIIALLVVLIIFLLEGRIQIRKG